VIINPSDAAGLGISQGDVVQLGNARGRTRLHARLSGGVKPGVLVSEGIWPPSAVLDGWGINVLVGDDSVAPYGGAAFHDVSVWARRA
jgi:anaerobic selenocysteine-containing dehydrogenase